MRFVPSLLGALALSIDIDDLARRSKISILITGASGRTSGYVLRALLASQTSAVPELRLLVYSEAAIEKLKAEFPQPQMTSFVIGDYLEAGTLPPALREVDVVFHNGPAFHPQETAMGIELIDAAK